MGVRRWFRSAATGRFTSARAAEARPGSHVRETSTTAAYERQLIEQAYADRIAKDIREHFPPEQALDIPAYIESRFGGVG